MNNKNAVLISIRQKWCEMICHQIGQDFDAKPVYKKNIEVRKSRPKMETPFKCYIYETQGATDTPFADEEGHMIFKGRGMVIGEFVCDAFFYITPVSDGNDYFFPSREDFIRTCITADELIKYGTGKFLYGWNISNLVIYDKPRELAEFGKTHLKKCDWKGCETCDYWKPVRVNADEFDMDCAVCGEIPRFVPLTRPPQSWCYVEVKDD